MTATLGKPEAAPAVRPASLARGYRFELVKIGRASCRERV